MITFEIRNKYTPDDRVCKAMLPIKKKIRHSYATSNAERVAKASIGASEVGAPKYSARELMFSLVTFCAGTSVCPLQAGRTAGFSEISTKMTDWILSTADVAMRNPITIRLELGERTRS